MDFVRRSKFAFITLFALCLALASAAAAATGDITTVAGIGTAGAAGDGGQATAAQLNAPGGLALLSDGSVLVADTKNNRVRKIALDGTITTVAGIGTAGAAGDGGQATAAQLNQPGDVAVESDGSILIADTGNNRVRMVATDGTISTVAGTGSAGSAGDGGQATAAQINKPASISPLSTGGFLIADSVNNRIRMVAADGTITTVAGTGSAGNSGDGGLATAAKLNTPTSVEPLAAGGFLIADSKNNRVRAVAADGTISTVAGIGTAGSAGDGGPAISAQLNAPGAVAPLSDGSFLIADTKSNLVRLVAADGTISTVAGVGTVGATGDGGPATAAQLSAPADIVSTGYGGFLIADSANNRVRSVEGAPAPPPPPTTTTTTVSGTTTTTTTTVDPLPTTTDPSPVVAPAVVEPTPSEPAPTPSLVRFTRVEPVLQNSTVTATAAGVVPLVVGCPSDAGARCTGTITLTVVIRSKRASMSRRGQQTLKVAGARFSVAPGKKTKIKAHLSRRGKALLARKGSLKVTAKISRRGGPNLGSSKQDAAVIIIKAHKRAKKARGRA